VDAGGPAAIVDAFLDAFARGDLVALGDLLDDSFEGLVTTADGGTVTIDAERYLASVAAMDVVSADLRLSVADRTPVDDDSILVMIEVRAGRRGRTLHNFSGQLAQVHDGRIVRLAMVDALPAESDDFWSA
jgi:ketosteroid isomerase-like protein